jgi:ABC-2 type transport system permease protein
MIGLIIKDLLNLKKQMGIFLLLLLFYLVLAFSSGESSILSGLIYVICMMLPITALAYDERAGWDRYALTMPISRSQLVLGKYVLGFVFCLVGFAFITVFQMITGEDLREGIIVSAILLGGSILLQAIILPVMFRIGTEKARIFMMAVFLAPAAIILMISKTRWKPSIDAAAFSQLLALLPVLLPLLLIGIVAASIALSLSFYRKKEF